jgi:hypothetical protein
MKTQLDRHLHQYRLLEEKQGENYNNFHVAVTQCINDAYAKYVNLLKPPRET